MLVYRLLRKHHFTRLKQSLANLSSNVSKAASHKSALDLPANLLFRERFFEKTPPPLPFPCSRLFLDLLIIWCYSIKGSMVLARAA